MPFLVAAVFICAWSFAAAVVNPAQFADSLEQLNWSHSLELGYWKHPPLPTWLIGGLIRVFGFSVYWTYALAALCFIGTVFFTWHLAKLLFDSQTAMLTVLLLSLQIGFSWRAQLYNHNTVLVLFCAATVWATLVAVQVTGLWVWVRVGVFAGLAMLSKYQAVVPFLGILIALYLSGCLKKPAVQRGVVCAIAVASLVFMPHLVWIMSGNGSTIHNAFNAAEGLSLGKRLMTFVGFWLIQLRFHIPVFIAIACLVLFGKAAQGSITKPATSKAMTDQQSAWFYGLVVWPAFFLSAAVLLGGMRLEAQWGLQTLQFVVPFIAWRLSLAAPASNTRRTVVLVTCMQLILGGFFAWSIFQPHKQFWQGQRSRNFPAADISKELVGKWHDLTACRLKYISGPAFEASAISAYSGQNPIVLEDGDFRKSPWVSETQLKEFGALYLAEEIFKLPQGLVATGYVVIPARVNDIQPIKQLYWGVSLPQMPCK